LWFRDTYPFDVMKSTLLPEYYAEIKNGKRRTVKIWSAACSFGQEPYSTAMTILEFSKTATGFKPEVFEILATDISPSGGKPAKTVQSRRLARLGDGRGYRRTHRPCQKQRRAGNDHGLFRATVGRNDSRYTLLYENFFPLRVVKRARGFESSRIGLIVRFDFKRHFPAIMVCRNIAVADVF